MHNPIFLDITALNYKIEIPGDKTNQMNGLIKINLIEVNYWIFNGNKRSYG
jgi:hypothetical protein